MMEGKFTQPLTVPLSRCDDTGRLSLVGALAEFMDMATLHAEMIGVGGAAMAQKHLFWLTVRTRIRFYQRPAMLQTVDLTTWPGAIDGMRCARYYTMTRGDRMLAEAKTQWAVFDTEVKRPVPVAPVFPPDVILPDDTVCGGSAFAHLREVPEETVCTYTVRSVDLDIGGHMNNVAYIPMLLGTLSAQELHPIRELETVYRRPCLEGETLSIRRQRSENGWAFAAVKADGEVAVLSRALECFSAD